MPVTPTIDTQSGDTQTGERPTSTQQLRLLTAPGRARRTSRARRVRRPQRASDATVWLDARTRALGQSGVAEARRRLAEIDGARNTATRG